MTADRATSRGSSPVATASNQPPGGGKRKADATGEGDAKRARTSGVGAAGGPAAGAGATSSRASSPSRPGSRAGSPGARTAANAVEQEVIDLVRAGTIKNTGELVQHFKKRLKADPGLKELLSAAVRRVAIMDKVSNTLKVKDGY